MKYQILGKNIEVTDAIRSAVEKKLDRMNKYFVINDEVTCRVVVRSYKVGAKIEVTIFTPQMDFRAEVTNADLYAGVDLAIDKLEGQMRKLKTRMDRSKSGKIGLGEAVAIDTFEPYEDEPEEEETVVRTKSVFLEPMTIDEAVTRMEAIDHDFYMYLDVEDDKIAVVYRRNDGGYGVLEAENDLK
ncbi:MAG: ribosome-associated translation inhibitor RaiA [Bacilli bacterium]|nr:ribosome-associated translation inhibitor RaiA [Bacilli bacterium]